MMDYDAQLKLQAYLDGELTSREARHVEQLLAEDREAASLLGELKSIKSALVGFEQEIKLPETREFYWSKIERAIRLPEAARPQVAVSSTIASQFRRLLIPFAGLAVLVIAALMVFPGPQGSLPMETAFADPGTLIYHDYSAQATFVWLSYPAEDEATDRSDTGDAQ